MTRNAEGTRAQSEVIGVVLLVGIVVVAAGIAGVFLIDLGDTNVEKSPTAKFDAEQYDGEKVWLYHAGGETISDPDTLSITINGTDVFEANGEKPSDYVDEVNATTEFYLGGTESNPEVGTKPSDVSTPMGVGSKVEIVWNSKEEDNSATLFEYEVQTGD